PLPEPAKAEPPKPAEAAPAPPPAPAAEAKPAAPLEAKPAPAATPVVTARRATFRVTLTHTNGRAGPAKEAAVVRVVTPRDVLIRTGASKGRWFEVDILGATGPTARVWVHETVMVEIK
ncbi:MAG: hypothetical protein WCO00_00935, partial [Rhodospirillaceae bacterium]